MGASKSRANSHDNPRADTRNRQHHEETDNNIRYRQPYPKINAAAVKMATLQTPAAPFVPKRMVEPHLHSSDYDAEAKRRMQDQLAWDSQTFVLNQLLLGVQIFDNYEREMWQAVGRNRLHENQKTRQIERHCKVAVLPDRLQEAVDRHIKYRPKYGLNKNTDRPLYTQTMYIVHENIEVTNPGERSNYSILTDAPIYKMEIDTTVATSTSKRRHNSPIVGYIRLRCVEGIRINNDHSEIIKDSTLPHVEDAASSDADDNNDEEVVDSKPKSKSTQKTHSKHRDSIVIRSEAIRRRCREQYTAKAASQTSSSSSAENDYTYIRSLNVRKPLNRGVTEAPSENRSSSDQTSLSTSTLPDSCFTHVTEDFSSDDDEHEYENDMNNNNKETSHSDYSRRRHHDVHQYLNAKTFLGHFVAIFRDRLADDVGITPAHLNTATWKTAVITAQPWDIVPALSCPWPNEAFEWIHRQRDIKLHPVTQQRFQWPTPSMVSKVVSFGCLAIPLARFVASSNQPEGHADLQWKLVFPNAERYLEGCLTSAQCKVYVVTKALLQTFIEPYICSSAFGAEHLRAHLFWQCENNYAAWPEEYLGEALVRFLNALLEHIKRQRLSDYFLPGRNLFESVPERVMVDLHRRIFRITENPVMYTLIALRNLRWLVDEKDSSPNAFPIMDLKHLYGIMTVDNPLAMVNPNLRATDAKSKRATDNDGNMSADEVIENAMGAIGYHQRVQRDVKSKRRKTRKVRFIEAKYEQVHEDTEAFRRVSVESIDVRFPIVRHMEQLRRVLIFEIFIAHFVQLARKALSHRAHNQALIYLRQAGRLCALLGDDDRIEQAASHAIVIETLQQVVQNELERDVEAKPQLPIRESVREACGTELGRGRRVEKVDLRSMEATKTRPKGSYTNVEAIKGTARTMPSTTPKELTVCCDVHAELVLAQEDNEDASVEVRRPQTPIGAISFFERAASVTDIDEDVTAL